MSMNGLGDYVAALRMRDLLQKLIKTEVDTQRPALQYATVDSIDRANRKCGVKFTGQDTVVKVNMGAVQPSVVGQTVRIDGLTGDRFISDVLGPVYLSAPTVDAFTGAVVVPAGDVSMGDVGSTATRVFRVKRKASSGTNYYETRQYQADSGATSNFAVQMRENDVEVNRLELVRDGTAILGPVGGARSNLATTAYVDPSVKGVMIPSGADLNTYTTSGFYTQNTNANAAAGTNYPRPLAGVLEVKANANGDGLFIYQRYTLYGSYSPEEWIRTYYSVSGWSPWSVAAPPGTLIRVGRNIRTTNTTNATTEYNICSITLNNPQNGDTYAVRGTADISPDTAGMFTALRIKHASGANVGGTQVGQKYIDHRIAGRVVGGMVEAEFTYTGTSGATGYNVVLVGGPSGGGSLCQASATQPATLYVDKVL